MRTLNPRRNYKGIRCGCGVEVTTGSKSGLCKSCSARSRPNNKPILQCLHCKQSFKISPSRVKTRKYCSSICRSQSQIGKKLPPERVAKSVEGHRGSKSHFWKGGLTAINKIIRGSYEYKLWRESVFQRDDYTCQFCFKRGGEIHADHIEPFAYFIDKRFDINNGRTLCAPCHRGTDTFGSKVKAYGTTSETT